jgi:hypothetical protein
MIAAIDGKQPGDPVRAAQIFVDLYTMPDPPVQLVLGAGALATYRGKLADLRAGLDRLESLSMAADYPAP